MKKLLTLSLLVFASTAFAQFYVPPYTPWRQTLLTNRTVAGVRSDLGIINATNVVVNENQLATTDDILAIKDGALATNVTHWGTLAFPSAGAIANATNASFNFYAVGAAASGPTLYRSGLTNDIYIRWCNMDDTNTTFDGYPPSIGIGPDYALPEATYFTMYDNVIGQDVFMVGQSNSTRGHFLFGPGGYSLDPTVTFTFADNKFDMTTNSLAASGTQRLQSSMVIQAVTNGLGIHSTNIYSDLLYLAGASGANHFLRFGNDAASYAYDWRIGLSTNALHYNDLTFYNTDGGTSQQPNAPGRPYLRLHPLNQPFVWVTNLFEGAASCNLTYRVDMTAGNISWYNSRPGGGSGVGWAGFTFTNAGNGFAITKLGRYVKTNTCINGASHRIVLLERATNSATWTTNTTVLLPRTSLVSSNWVFGDCYAVVSPNTQVFVMTDTTDGLDYWGAWGAAVQWDDTTMYLGAKAYGTYVTGDLTATPPSVMDVNANYGPLAYVRKSQ